MTASLTSTHVLFRTWFWATTHAFKRCAAFRTGATSSLAPSTAALTRTSLMVPISTAVARVLSSFARTTSQNTTYTLGRRRVRISTCINTQSKGDKDVPEGHTGPRRWSREPTASSRGSTPNSPPQSSSPTSKSVFASTVVLCPATCTRPHISLDNKMFVREWHYCTRSHKPQNVPGNFSESMLAKMQLAARAFDALCDADVHQTKSHNF
jgi:hypothetical protein